MAIYNGVNITETVHKNFTNSVHDNYLSDGFRLKETLGEGKYTVATTDSDEIYFTVTTEIIAQEKPREPGTFATPSPGGKFVRVGVKPKAYIVNSYIDMVELDETGLNLKGEIVKMHSRAMGYKSDEIYINALEEFVDAQAGANDIGAVGDKINFDLWGVASGGEKGFAYMTSYLAGIAPTTKKWLVIDSRSHAKLVENEMILNNDFYTKGIVETGNLDGKMFGGFKIILMEDKDTGFHTSAYFLRANESFIVFENAMCFGSHKKGLMSKIEQLAIINMDWLIQTHMSFGTEVLSRRGVYRVHTEQ